MNLLEGGERGWGGDVGERGRMWREGGWGEREGGVGREGRDDGYTYCNRYVHQQSNDTTIFK